MVGRVLKSAYLSLTGTFDEDKTVFALVARSVDVGTPVLPGQEAEQVKLDLLSKLNLNLQQETTIEDSEFGTCSQGAMCFLAELLRLFPFSTALHEDGEPDKCLDQ